MNQVAASRPWLADELCEVMTGFNTQNGFFFFFPERGANPAVICSDPLMVILSTPPRTLLHARPLCHCFSSPPSHVASLSALPSLSQVIEQKINRLLSFAGMSRGERRAAVAPA